MRVIVRAFAAALAIAAAFGCSGKGAFKPNLPPETILFVQGPVDTVNHIVHLFWFGTDQDGFVSGFELRFKNPANPSDTAWVATTRTDSVFTVFSPTGLTRPVFEVRAIDDAGQRDPTPAVQTFTFSNKPPSVTLVNPPRDADSTFASVTLTWSPADPDGDVGRMSYRVWLDGNEANARLATSTTYTVPTADFRQGGMLLSGYRKAFVQAIDDGGLAGAIDSTRWFVRAPSTGARARVLLIDDVPTTNAANFSTDTMYTEALTRNIPPGEWTRLQMQFSQPFRSNADVAQTFSLFEAVIWYRGTEQTFSPVLGQYEGGVGAYLDAGGKVMLEGFDLVQGLNANGALSQNFMQRYLGADRLYRHFDISAQDSVATWGIDNFRVLHSPLFQDSLRSQVIRSGLRGFVVRDTNHVALWARAGALSQPHDYDIPVGVSVPIAGGGRAIAITVPMRAVNGFLTVPRLLPKILQQMGVLGP